MPLSTGPAFGRAIAVREGASSRAPAGDVAAVDLVGVARLQTVAVSRSGGAPPVLKVRLEWLALGTPVSDYRVYVHLVCGETLRAQHDGVPAQGRLPTTGWVEGQWITDEHEIPLDESVACASPELRIGLYDPLTGVRVPSSDGRDGFTLRLDEALLTP